MAAQNGQVDDVTKKLINDMFSRFQNENKELLKSINVIIHEAVKEEFGKLLDRMNDQEKRLMDTEVEHREQAKEITRLSTMVEDQQAAINNLRLSTEDLEQYSRRNCLQFFGVQEQDNEVTDDVICKIARDQLGLEIFTQDIDRSHRLGNPNKTPAEKNGKPGQKRPRPIVVKFVSYRTRYAVISRRRRLKGTRVVIQEQLTKYNLHLLNSAKKTTNVQTAWSSDGRIIARITATNGKTINRIIRSENDLRSL